MNLPILVVAAIAVPLLVFLGLYFFMKSSVLFALRPRVFATVSMVFGAFYVGFGLWEGRNGFHTDSVLPIVLGVMFLVNGVYHWFRGQSVKLE